MSLAENLLRGLLDAADPETCAAHSFDNFHARGLRYVNLLRTPQLTAKLYIARPGQVETVNGEWLVNPHNHAYRFDTLVLSGRMRNLWFDERPGGAPRHRFRFESRLNGTPRAEWDGLVELYLGSYCTLRPGDSYHLRPDEVHTITVSPVELTILFLLQYRDERSTTRLYMPTGAPPSLQGLYTRLTPAQVEADLQTVRTLL